MSSVNATRPRYPAAPVAAAAVGGAAAWPIWWSALGEFGIELGGQAAAAGAAALSAGVLSMERASAASVSRGMHEGGYPNTREGRRQYEEDCRSMRGPRKKPPSRASEKDKMKREGERDVHREQAAL